MCSLFLCCLLSLSLLGQKNCMACFHPGPCLPVLRRCSSIAECPVLHLGHHLNFCNELGILSVCMSMHQVLAQCLWRPERGVECPWTGVTKDCEALNLWAISSTPRDHFSPEPFDKCKFEPGPLFPVPCAAKSFALTFMALKTWLLKNTKSGRKCLPQRPLPSLTGILIQMVTLKTYTQMSL